LGGVNRCWFWTGCWFKLPLPYIKGHFTLCLKVERPSISTNHIARNQEFDLLTLHTKAKVQRPPQFKMLTFDVGDRLSKEVWVRGMETQNYGREAIGFFHIKKSIIGKILAIRLEGLFWARNKVGCTFGFGLWAWPLEASHCAWPKAPLTTFYWLFSTPFLWTLNRV
jgi:hypothetical protein